MFIFVAFRILSVAFRFGMTTEHATRNATPTILAIRVPIELIDRIDNFLASRRAELPGVTLTRSDALRLLIERGLDSNSSIAA